MKEMQRQRSNIKTNKAVRALKRDFNAWLFLIPAIILLFVIVWWPMIMSTIWSFFEMNGFTPGKFVGLKNYQNVLSDTQFIKTLINTCEYVFWSILIGYIPPIFMAICLNEVIHCRGFFRFSMYFPSIIPSIATSMIFFLIFYPNAGGFLNMICMGLGLEPQQWLQNSNMTILMIIISMTWNYFGQTAVYYLAALQGINQELYEAAIVDGAGLCRRVWIITLPQISGIMILFFVKQIISVFQIMEQPLTMTGGGPNNASLTLALQGYRYAFEYGNVSSSLALGVITFIMLLFLTIVYFVLEKKCNDN